MKILVVDDEKDIKALFEPGFRKAIQEKKAEFVSAFFCDKALRYLTQHQHEAVLILSDINISGMSGFELHQKINERFHSPTTIIMMITACGDKENYDNALRMGADNFFSKPNAFALFKQKLKFT